MQYTYWGIMEKNELLFRGSTIWEKIYVPWNLERGFTVLKDSLVEYGRARSSMVEYGHEP